MLWQLAYTEFWFTDVLWPDFNEKHLVRSSQGIKSGKKIWWCIREVRKTR